MPHIYLFHKGIFLFLPLVPSAISCILGIRACGETGRRDRLRICWGNPWRFESSQAHFIPLCSRLIFLGRGAILGHLRFQSILSLDDTGFTKIDPLGCARSSSAPRPILPTPCHGRRNHKNHRRPSSPNATPDGRGQKTKNSTIYPTHYSPSSPSV